MQVWSRGLKCVATVALDFPFAFLAAALAGTAGGGALLPLLWHEEKKKKYEIRLESTHFTVQPESLNRNGPGGSYKAEYPTRIVGGGKK